MRYIVKKRCRAALYREYYKAGTVSSMHLLQCYFDIITGCKIVITAHVIGLFETQDVQVVGVSFLISVC